MRKPFVQLALAFSALLSCTTNAYSSYLDDYTPITKADRQSRFPLKLIAEDKQLQQEQTVAGCKMHLDADGELEITGVDAQQKPWKLTTQFGGLGTWVYSGDLDKNGIEDIVIATATGGCGLAPPRGIDTIMFDRQKRPVYWGASVYGEASTKNSMEGLLRLGGDPRCVIVEESLAYHSQGERTFSYWETALYRAENAGWHLVRSYRGNTVPMFVRYRFKPNHQLVKRVPSDLKNFVNLSTYVGPTEQIGIKKLEVSSATNAVDMQLDWPPGHTKISEENFYGGCVAEWIDGTLNIATYGSQASGRMLQRAFQKGQKLTFPANMSTTMAPPTIWIGDLR